VNTTGRPLLFPDEIRRLDDDLCIVLGRHSSFLCRRLVYYEDYPFYRAARFDPTHFRNQQQQIQNGDAKTAAVLPQLARQQITSFESGKAALFPGAADGLEKGQHVLRFRIGPRRDFSSFGNPP
jgi:type IV secretory pathway TraG/TraD family ATPase VirD4